MNNFIELQKRHEHNREIILLWTFNIEMLDLQHG